MIPPRLLLYAGAAVAMVAAVAFGVTKVYRAGYEAADAKAQATIAEARAEAQAARADKALQVAQANARALRVESAASGRIAAAQRQAQQFAQIAKRSADEDPAFASARRPADLERVRDQQLADIAAAAGRPADVPADGIPAVRPAGDHAGGKPGAD